MKRNLAVKAFFGCVILISACPGLFAARADDAANGPIFRIGTFDRSSAEFAPDSPSHAVVFTVGESNAAKDWFATQMAVSSNGARQAAAMSGGSAAAKSTEGSPWSINFSLNAAPSQAYSLHLALLVETPGLPSLRVSINGKQGKFYLQPEIDLEAGDMAGLFHAPYSHADLVVEFPASYLRKGKNTIALLAQEEGDDPSPLSSLTYDAIELDHASGAFDPQGSSARISPTIYYRQTAPTGPLSEEVDIVVRSNQRVKPGSALDVSIGGDAYHEKFLESQDFGEEKFELSVPEFPPQTRIQAAWTVGGHKWRATQTIDPQKKWTLYLVPHIHVDIGYSDYQAKVAAIQSRVLDEALKFCQENPEFRFSTDGEWNMEQFMKTRAVSEQNKLIAAIQNQKIFIPAQYANLLTGFPTAETLIRSLYPSAGVSRKYQSPFNYANITDVPSYSWSYASILASAGIKDFLAASDNYRAPVLLQGRLNENSPVWWQGPDGQKVLFWYSRHYQQMEFVFGLPPHLSAGKEILPLFMRQYEHPGYRADAAIMFGTQAENTDLFPQQATFAERWDKQFAYPRLKYSGVHDALESVAKQFHGDLPTIRGDGGPYWEDGFGSNAYYTAMERGNEGRAPTAEKLQTLTSIINPRLAPDKAGLDRMWNDMVLSDEHTFTSYNATTDPTSAQASRQLAVKNLNTIDAHALADWLTRNGMASIADSISAGRGTVIVFNSLNWSRSGLVDFDLKKGYGLVDATSGDVVPLEVLHEGNAFRRVRFVASDVPAVGYKVFLEKELEKTAAAAQSSQSTVLENSYYRVQLDPASGAIESIFDKQLQQELVNQQSSYRFGQYLYVTGGDKLPNSIVQYRAPSPEPTLTIHPASEGSLLSVRSTPYGWTAQMKSRDTNTPQILTEIRLFNHKKKLEIIEDVDKKKVESKEGVYFAFPFAMSHPRFQYEIQTGTVDPERDQYAGAGKVWFSAQHWVSAEQSGVSGTIMPLDAPLVTLGDINRGQWPTQFGQRIGTIFSYVMNNYWDTNTPAAQGGHFRFRYVVTSATSTNPPELSRLGWDEMTPLEVDEVTTQDKAVSVPRPLDGKQGTFLVANDPNLLLETWKPAEDGNGTILRFLDLGGAARTVSIQTPYLNVKRAWKTDAVERGLDPLTVSAGNTIQFSILPHEIVTLRLVGSDAISPN